MGVTEWPLSSKHIFGLCIILSCISSKNYSNLFWHILVLVAVGLGHGVYRKFYTLIRGQVQKSLRTTVLNSEEIPFATLGWTLYVMHDQLLRFTISEKSVMRTTLRCKEVRERSIWLIWNCNVKIWCWRRQQSDVNETGPSGNTVLYSPGVNNKQIKIYVVPGAVEEMNQVKYLGVHVDNQLKRQQQLDHMRKKLACASSLYLSCGSCHPSPLLKLSTML